MKIEAGKYYKARDGRKVGPMERNVESAIELPWLERGNDQCAWHGDGKRYVGSKAPEWDLVAEWTDEPTSPVRTVTRREIVPGTYGLVVVSGGPDQGGGPFVRVVLGREAFDASELRAAAKVFTDLADALDEQGSAS